MFHQLARWYAERSPNLPIPGSQPLTATQLAEGTAWIFSLHPLQLLRFLEEVWAHRAAPGARPDLPVPDDLMTQPGLGSGIARYLGGVPDDIYDTVAGTPSNLPSP